MGSFLGYFVGIFPAAGATPGSIMAYGMAKTMSKDPESFGKGNVEGIVAPESANNAASTGSMLPMLTLGITGKSSGRNGYLGGGARTDAVRRAARFCMGFDRKFVRRQLGCNVEQSCFYTGIYCGALHAIHDSCAHYICTVSSWRLCTDTKHA